MNLITDPAPTMLAVLLVLGLVAMVFVPLFALRKIANGRGERVSRWLEILLPAIYALLVILNIASGEISWMTAMWAALCVAWAFMAWKMRSLRKRQVLPANLSRPD